MNQKTKFIIAPSHAIGEYWIKQMDLDYTTCRIVTPTNYDRMLRGIPASNIYAFLYEETFDYPENAVGPRHKQAYIEMCEWVEHYYNCRKEELGYESEN